MLNRLILCVVLALLLLMLLGAFSAWSQSSPVACGPKATVFEQAKKKFNEVPRLIGLTTDTPTSNLFVVLVDKDDNSWTAGLMLPNGTFCVMAAGEDFQDAWHKPTGTPMRYP